MQDIRDAFHYVQIVGVHIERNEVRPSSAKISLLRPEVLDSWDRHSEWVKYRDPETGEARDKEVSVCVGNSDGWLCVAKLPLELREEEFLRLAEAYGKVREAFLVASEKTGELHGLRDYFRLLSPYFRPTPHISSSSSSWAI